MKIMKHLIIRRANQGHVLSQKYSHRLWLKLSALVLGSLVLTLVQTSKLLAVPQLDQMGLVPPRSSDQDPYVVQIRKSLSSWNILLMKKDVHKLIQAEPGNYEGYFWLGFLDLQFHHDYDAVRALRKAEARDPNSYVLKLLAVTYYTLHQFRLFTLMMHRAMQRYPRDYAPYYYLGRYYITTRKSEFEKGSEYFQKALRLDPQNFRSSYYLGYCYEVQGKWKEAEKKYQRSMKLSNDADVDFPLPYDGMARLKILESAPSDALPYAKKAVELAPNAATSHTVLAKVYSALGQPANAVTEWKLVTELDQTDAAPYYHLFQIYSALGMKEKAKEALASFKKLALMYGTQ